MKLPGFTGERSLYKTTERYNAVGLLAETERAIYPQGPDAEVDTKCYWHCYRNCLVNCQQHCPQTPSTVIPQALDNQCTEGCARGCDVSCNVECHKPPQGGGTPPPMPTCRNICCVDGQPQLK
jgi:hypothetical protein